MANERILTANYLSTLNVKYRNIASNVANTTAKDDVRYLGGKFNLTSGAEPGQVDLQYKDILTAPAGGLQIDLDGGITNIWEDILDFYRIKYVLIKNLETIANRNLLVTSANEQYVIGPLGYRTLYEPDGSQRIAVSSIADRGTITFIPVDSTNAISFEIIILGTSTEDNISSGL